jgi:formylglycine-generating enzyme required for sulfatase activity
MELANKAAVSIAVPGLLLAAMVMGGLALATHGDPIAASTVVAPAVVSIAPHTSLYRVAGEYLRQGIPVDAPKVQGVVEPLSIMKFQVSQSEYAVCVGDGACKAAADLATDAGTWPVTGVSFVDATNYAAWLSRTTGGFWRLPSDEEWASAAGSRFSDDGLGLAASADPSLRWRAAYAFEYRGGANAVTELQPQSHFGANEFGLVDLSGNVWEWTSTCYDRVLTNPDGATASMNQNCGVRVLEGQHRTYQTNFIRDARGGGCAVGKPPDHLGFRLVRDLSPIPFIDRLKTWWFYR